MSARQLAYSREFSAPTHAAIATPFARVGPVLIRLRRQLIERQRADGSWCERAIGDGSAEAALVIALAFAGRAADPRCARLARTLLDQQDADGGWGDFDATVRAYFALSLAGFGGEAMERARGRLADFGSGRCAGLTRLLLALFDQAAHDDWTALPAAGRSDELALRVLDARRPRRARPKDPVLAHLFRHEFWLPDGPFRNPVRTWAGRRAGQELREHLAHRDAADAGGPTSVLPLLALHALGLSDGDPAVQSAHRLLGERLVEDGGRLRVAAALAPLRDTAQALAALREAGLSAAAPPVAAAGAWLWARLVRGQARGDLAVADAAAALIALARSGFAFHGDRTTLIDHVLQSIFDAQEDAGGWRTPAQTGLVLEALGEFGIGAEEPVVADAASWLEGEQNADSGWSGGGDVEATARVLIGLRTTRCDMHAPMVRRAAAWLKRTQHAGGGWSDEAAGPAARTTASAVLALLAAGEAGCAEVDAGVDWLLAAEAATLGDAAGTLAALAQFERHGVGLAPRL